MNTILIVDDHAGFRVMARALLEADGFEVIAEADGAASAMANARTGRPAVVLLDVNLPDGNGFDVAQALRAELPMTRIVLTSSHDATSFGPRLRESGLPFLPKDELSGRAIRELVTAA